MNIAHKIFGIAIVVLILMAAVAVFSVRLTAEISGELHEIANKQLPLSESVGRINVRILEQGILLQRLFALPEETPHALDRINELGARVDAEFAKAKALFEAAEKSKNAPATIFELHRSLIRVEH